MDVHENKVKEAVPIRAYGTNAYILLNWQNKINDLFTLAHEFGHSVHNYCTRKYQPYPYGDYSILLQKCIDLQ